MTLTLVRDTYRQGDSVRELLDFHDQNGDPASRDDIIDHLLDRVLPTAYTQRPGHPPLIYDLDTAQHALRCIAAQMNKDGTRDLRWWHIPRWAPSAPRALITGLTLGLLFGLVTGLLFGLVTGLTLGLVAGVLGGLLGGLMFGLGSALEREPPQRIKLAGWNEMIRSVGGLVAGVVAGVATWLVIGPVFGLVAGVVAGVVTGLVVWLVLASSQSGVDHISSFAPPGSWRNEQRYWLVVGLIFVLAIGLTGAHRVGLLVALVAGLVTGLVTGVVFSETWSASLAFVQLAERWHTPVRIMRLLEDAHQRSILRTVGPVYQFRHARLQDRLAEQMPGDCQQAAEDRRAINGQLARVMRGQSQLLWVLIIGWPADSLAIIDPIPKLTIRDRETGFRPLVCGWKCGWPPPNPP